MADITVAEFRTYFPEFTTDVVTDRDATQWLETAYQLSDVTREATMFTTAHLVALDRGERVAGAVAPVDCLLYTSPSPRDRTRSRMPSSA